MAAIEDTQTVFLTSKIFKFVLFAIDNLGKHLETEVDQFNSNNKPLSRLYFLDVLQALQDKRFKVTSEKN